MKKKSNISFAKINYFCLLMLFFVASCAPIQQGPSVQKEPSQFPEPTTSDPDATETQKIELIEILNKEALKFIEQGSYKDALFVYNQTLAHVHNEVQFNSLINKIEDVLAKMQSQEIVAFLEIQNTKIPRALLIYWLGLNLALEGDTLQAGEVLNSFMSYFPNHPYYPDASNLLELLKKSSFNKDTIGVLLPMTGQYAIFGERALRGIQLAVKHLSEKYNKNFKIIIEDTQADPEKAIEGLRQLYLKNVSAIIGPWLTAVEAGEEVEKLQIPMVALTQKTDFPLQGDYLFSNFITPKMQVKTLGSYLFETLGIKKVAILYPDDKYGQTYMNLFWDMVDQYNGQIMGVESYDKKGTDFTTAIQKISGEFYPIPEELKPDLLELQEEGGEILEQNTEINLDPTQDSDSSETEKTSEEKEDEIVIDFEALFIPDSPQTIKLILPQLAFNDVKNVYLVGTNLWHNKTLVKEARGYNKNAVITDGFFRKTENQKSKEFVAEFKKIFKKNPEFIEAIAYDTTTMLFKTAMDETVLSTQDLKNALKEGRIFEGATGITRFDANGVSHRQLFLMTIKNNRFIEISR